MDPHPDDLSELERRLSSWEPASAGLNADAMLFAAGRAAALPGRTRFVWPALTGVLAVLVVVLGTWVASERAERVLLVQQLRSRTPAPSPNVSPPQPSTADEPAANSLLAAHRALEHGLDAWPPRPIGRVDPPGPHEVNPPVLQVGHRDTLLDP